MKHKDKPASAAQVVEIKKGASNKTAARGGRGRVVDWLAAERAYATGHFTQVELATRIGVAPNSVHRRIKTDRLRDPTRWQQNLTKDVNTAAAALLIQAGVSRTVENGRVAETIVAAASIVRDVILEHRGDIKEARATSSDMLAELRTATNSKEQLRAMLAVATAEVDDPAAVAEAKEAFGRLIRLHGRVASLQKMTDAMQKLQAMERKAFNIPDEVQQDDGPADKLTDAQLQAEIDRLQAEVERTRPYQEPEAPAQRVA